MGQVLSPNARGFVAGPDDIEVLTKLLGHKPRCYGDFAQETAQSWKGAVGSAALAA